MKDYLKRYSYSYVIISLLFIIISVMIKRRLNIDVSFLKLAIANLFISAFVALSISIYYMKRWDMIIKVLLSFVTLSPIILIFRRTFGVLLFRVSFAIYLFAFICTILYAVIVTAIATKAKKEEKDLNKLIKDKDKQ